MLERIRSGNGARNPSGLYFDDRCAVVAQFDSGGRLTGFQAERQDGDHGLADVVSRKIDSSQPALTSVLPFGGYQMLLVELPDLPEAELRDGVRWQIRELLEYPAEDTVVELFDVPAPSRAVNKRSAYAVAAHRNTLQQHVDTIHASGLQPAAIDIPELCIRNVAARCPQDADGVALLCFGETRGLLTVTRQGQLYFIRGFDIGTRSLLSGDGPRPDLLSSIVLEVQRSLDYYESHYDRRPVTDLLLTPAAGLSEVTGHLRNQLGLNVDALDLGELFDCDAEIDPEFQSQFLIAVGAALRDHSPDARGKMQ